MNILVQLTISIILTACLSPRKPLYQEMYGVLIQSCVIAGISLVEMIHDKLISNHITDLQRSLQSNNKKVYENYNNCDCVDIKPFLDITTSFELSKPFISDVYDDYRDEDDYKEESEDFEDPDDELPDYYQDFLGS